MVDQVDLVDLDDQGLWEVTKEYRTIRLSVPLNRMNGGLPIDMVFTHHFSPDYYGLPGTYGTNRFSITLYLKRRQADYAKLGDIPLFLTERYTVNADSITIHLPSNAAFDGKHTLETTKDLFRSYSTAIYQLADYLQAQQTY